MITQMKIVGIMGMKTKEKLSREVRAKLLLTQMVGFLVANGIDPKEVLDDVAKPRKRNHKNRQN